jgi:hypothetical protein
MMFSFTTEDTGSAEGSDVFSFLLAACPKAFAPATAAPSLRHANRNSEKFAFCFSSVCMAETRIKADVPGALSWFFFGQAKKNEIGLIS